MDPRITTTCIEMLQQRGYTDLDITDLYIMCLDKVEKVCLIFDRSSKFNIEQIKEYICFMDQRDIKRSIIVYNSDITSAVKKIISKIEGKIIELFLHDELKYNVTKHSLVPKHEKVTSNDVDFLKTFQLPIIRTDDAVARFYGFNKGDIIKITQNDNWVYYCVVREEKKK